MYSTAPRGAFDILPHAAPHSTQFNRVAIDDYIMAIKVMARRIEKAQKKERERNEKNQEKILQRVREELRLCIEARVHAEEGA